MWLESGNSNNNLTKYLTWRSSGKFNDIDLLTYPCSDYEGLDELLTRSCDNTNPLIKQLNAIDSVARLWLEMASKLDLDIFRGFKDEKSLLNFALNVNNSKAGDTSKVVAGQFWFYLLGWQLHNSG